MQKNSKIYVAGHKGLLGSAILKRLSDEGYTNILTADRDDVNLIDRVDVDDFFDRKRPEYVFMCAATVGGIQHNSSAKGIFIYENLMMQCNVIEACRKYNAVKILLPLSSCMYPRHYCTNQYILNPAEHLFEGKPEETNDAYAVAKLAGFAMLKAYNEQYNLNFVAPILTNLYGENDNLDVFKGHAVGSIIMKMILAKENDLPELKLIGTGTAMREFLHADDAARILIELMLIPLAKNIALNVGSGDELSIKQLVDIIKTQVGYKGDVIFDDRKILDGVERKRLDISKMKSFGLVATKYLATALPLIIAALKERRK